MLCSYFLSPLGQILSSINACCSTKAGSSMLISKAEGLNHRVLEIVRSYFPVDISKRKGLIDKRP